MQLTVIRSKQLSVSTGQGGSYQDTFQAPDNDSRNAVISDTGETITGLAPSSLTLIISDPGPGTLISPSSAELSLSPVTAVLELTVVFFSAS